MKTHLVVIAILNLFIATSFAQTAQTIQTPQPKPLYWDDVQVIKKYDGMFAPPVHPVLFTGSSSIRKWDDVQYTFAEYSALNRGIGGAVTNNIIYYLNDLVFKYQPKQIVLYVGENDLMDKVSTVDSVYNRTMKLYQAIRAKMPEVPILYIGMKPSPSREKFMPMEVDFNARIKNFLASEKNTVFVDVYPLMLNDGKLRPELYVGDKLHMTKLGYAVWEKAVRPYLIK
ncbi:MAG: family lipase [Mucilaginibacter sp.]|uniref:GDSL-type esterase/lipase family protein n=1 Tax=Mucilaginibacter sp. TaxID=1882438 RepID=UPI00261AF2CF|nr:GDSL-type esterase/lipase family protein [Mucilaginibacter sp.]MDB5003907.1 family lipase [Mucilaginibacter sp.]